MTRKITLGLAGLGMLALAQAASAHLHRMQIQQVVAGVDGDVTVQAIQLRQRFDGENFVSDGGRLRVWDATGANPITLIEFDADVPNGSGGDTILVVSPAFAAHTDQPLAADFVLTELIPASYLAAGSLTFDQITDTTIYWRLSWGGASYTGPNDGLCTNDDTPCPDPGDYGPPWPGALPSASLSALQFQGPFNARSTTNAADYLVTPGAATFTNNAGESATLVGGAACAGDCEAVPDGAAGTADLLALLAAWGTAGDCDLDGSGAIGTGDLLQLLSAWGPCP